MPSIGSLLVSSHSTLFAIAYKEKITSKLKYYATHLDSEDVFGLKIDVAITFASTTWQKVCWLADTHYMSPTWPCVKFLVQLRIVIFDADP